MTKKKMPQLKIEMVNDRGNLLYLSLIEYKRENYLCIIDNISPLIVGAYVLDYAEQENVQVSNFLSLVTNWFYSKSEKYPLSVEISRLGLTSHISPIYKTFDTAYVSRIIGKTFEYSKLDKTRVKRRRLISIPEGIEIRFKPLQVKE